VYLFLCVCVCVIVFECVYDCVYVCIYCHASTPVQLIRVEAGNKTTTKNLSVNDWKNVFRDSHEQKNKMKENDKNKTKQKGQRQDIT